MMTIKTAANELDSIRNTRGESNSDLIDRVNAIGGWLASQKLSKSVLKLLQECHQLADRLEGGSGKGGTRIAS